MNKEAAISIASEFIKKWEQLGSKSTSKDSTYSYEQSKSLPGNTTLNPYVDGDSYSIGWGSYDTLKSDGTLVRPGLTIDKNRADYEIDYEIRNVIIPIYDNLITADLNETQYAALLSFGYNAGPSAIKYNGLLDAVNNGGDVPSILLNTAVTDKRTHSVSSGLKNRRKDEVALYNGNYNELYSYYLRNSVTIDYAILGILIIGITGYLYFKKKN
jgi:LPXTG-motif cell wall-anchored protein